MCASANYQNEYSDEMQQTADAIFAYLRDIIYNPATASLDLDCLPESFLNVGKGLLYLHKQISETKTFAAELSKGNLNTSLPLPSNEIASPLKGLHATLSHLTWQAQQVASGDYKQRVDFMGEFALAFNHMAEQLEQQRQKKAMEKESLLIAIEESTQARRDAEYIHDLMRTVNETAELLLEADPTEYASAMTKGMEIIGKRVGFDRIVMCNNTRKDDGNLYFKQVSSWNGTGQDRVDYSYKDNLPTWEYLLSKGEVIKGPLYNLPEAEIKFLKNFNIQSILVIPIFINDFFWGFVSFDDCKKQRAFTEAEINVLRSWGLLIVGAMQRNVIAHNLLAVSSNYKGLIWSTDNSGTFTTFKGQHTKTLPLADDIEGKNIDDDLIKKIDNLDIATNVKKTFKEGPQNWISEIDERIFQSHTTLMYDASKTMIGVMGSTTDVTDMIKLQRSLEEANKAKSVFLATMSHEIRTPMNAILGMADLASRETVVPSVQEYLHTIRQAGGNLLDIINDILDISRIESGTTDLSAEKYAFSSVINDVAHIISIRAHEKHLRFIINIDNNIPDMLFGNPKRVRQIILNLLGNAVKYTDTGFISLSINGTFTDNHNIILTIQVADSGKGISQENISNLFEKFSRFDSSNIEGTGLGLAITKGLLESMNGAIEVQSKFGEGSVFTATLPQIIQEYHKIAAVSNVEKVNALIYERREICISSITETMRRLGVNYSLVSTAHEFYQEINSDRYTHVFVGSVLYGQVKDEYPNIKTNVKLMLLAEHGEIITQQNATILTTPIFSIPVANFLNGVSGYSDTKKEQIKRIAPNAKILSVDDIDTNLTVLNGFLKPYKMQVTSCKSGMEALEALKSMPYDLLFLDHMMPEMDGIETIKRIKELIDEYPHISQLPIIALTANAIAGTRTMFLTNGFDDYISKPIDTTALHNILIKWIPVNKWVEQKKIHDESENEPDINIEININALNIKKGLFMAGGTTKNYLNTLAVFHKDGIDKINQIKSCLNNNNLPLYVIYMHALKSASASIGADILSEAAKALEKAGQMGDMEFIEAHNNQIISDLETLLGEINATLTKVNDNESPASPDPEGLETELSILKDAIQKFDSASIKKATNTLSKYVKDPDIGTTIEGILQNIFNGDDDTAISLIDSILR